MSESCIGVTRENTLGKGVKTVFTQAFHLAGVQSVSLDLAIFLVICMYTTFVLLNCDI